LSFAIDVVDRLAGAEDRIALIFIDDAGHRRDYTFGEVSQQSQRYAAVLRAFGVGANERVLLRGSNTAKLIFTLLGLERLGAAGIPCAESSTAADVLHAVKEIGASTIVANRKYREQIDNLRAELLDVQRFIVVGEEAEGWARLDSLTARAQPYAGTPVPSVLSEAAHETPQRLHLAPTDRFWSTLALDNAAWIANTLLGAWSCGATMVVHEGQFDAAERLELLRELEVTVLLQNASEFEAQAALENLAQVRLPRLRRCLCPGDPPDAQSAQRWLDAIHIPLERVPSGVRSLQRT
jgi:acyl-coenzyme A synthetase/AMP-(fatty) acid ligase